jgi:ribonuclease HI
MEVLALKEGLIMARSIGARKIAAETDCAEVVHLWNALNTQRSAVSSILGDIKDLSRSFDEFSLLYLNRSSNRVAHECAKRVSKEHRVEKWHVAPPALVNLLVEDCKHDSV